MKTIWFDMDGTIADFYSVHNWLDYLKREDTTPYEIAKPIHDYDTINDILNTLRKNGYSIGIISYVSHSASAEYASRTAIVKNNWLKANFPAVDIIHICTKETPKSAFYCEGDYLVDDEDKNLDDWRRAGGSAIRADKRMLNKLKKII